ncbi:MAG: glycosyltransferase, partial [Eubacterium sp.]|nr:glycosyltransferase [Eubacterium sp.]
MKILIIEWSAYMQYDLEDYLRSEGIEVVEYGYRIENFEKDDYFYRQFDRILAEEKPDGVMMMNYMAPMARLCYDHKIPYISWVYDCPFGLQHPEETLGLDTNRVFFFDKEQERCFSDRGFRTVFHRPLAVDAERLDRLIAEVDPEEVEKYSADISFVGTMYGNDFAPLRNRLSKETGEKIDALMDEQIKLYCNYIIRDSLKDIITPEMRSLFSDMDELYDADDAVFMTWIEHTIANEITRRERLYILRLASERGVTALYSPAQETALPKVSYRGILSAYDTAPLVYRQSKINLNMTLKDITSGIPLRVLDIMGAGGFLLTNRQPEIEEYFEAGKELVMYDGIEDAIKKIEYYLAHED